MIKFFKNNFKLSFFAILAIFMQISLFAQDEIKYGAKIRLQAVDDGQYVQVNLGTSQAQISLSKDKNESTELILVKANAQRYRGAIKYGDEVLIKSPKFEDTYFKAVAVWKTWTWSGQVSKNLDMERYKWVILDIKDTTKNLAIVKTGEVLHLKILSKVYMSSKDNLLSCTTDVKEKVNWKIEKVPLVSRVPARR
ncbi:MAG: hypothetical protein WC436_04760 [Candidatus Babeliales bacterium]